MINKITNLLERYSKKCRVKKITKLRTTARYYQIEITDSLFGDFGGRFKNLHTYIVLARNHRDAVERLRKRGVSLDLCFGDDFTTEKWARYKIKEVGKPETHRHIFYI